jgi:hypothetical protein
MKIRLDHHLHFDTPIWLSVIELEPPPPPPSGSVVISAKIEGFVVTAKGPHMAYTLPADKQVLLKVEFLDAKGNHATVDGDPSWSSSDPNVATAEATPGNPWLADLKPVSVGTCQVKVEADADLGEGVRPVLCTMDVEVVGGEAVVGVISPASEQAPPSPGGS